jgi:glycosyltransferase involved in cell wall biosynthesis
MKKTAVIIPCYNEADNILQVIDDILAHTDNSNMSWLLIVVNDCSADNTAEIVRRDGRAVLIDLPCNLGVGAAVQTGFRYAAAHGCDYAVKFDGDGQHQADTLNELIRPLLEQRADMTIGSRFIQKETEGFQSTPLRRIGIHWLRLMIKIFSGAAVADPTSGLRAYNRRALAFARKYYPSFDYPEPEEVILMRRNNFTIEEVYTPMRERRSGVSSISPLKSVYYMLKVSFAIFMVATRPPEPPITTEE